jgi:CheY-like chemotaxis protein
MPGELILIVDDNPGNMKLVSYLLEKRGYDVRAATGADEALQLLETCQPRLILMDLQMPGVDGFELTRRLKADPKTRDIVIVAVTAYAMKGDEQRALEAGCDGYVTKPIDTRTLPALIAAHLAKGKTGPV